MQTAVIRLVLGRMSCQTGRSTLKGCTINPLIYSHHQQSRRLLTTNQVSLAAENTNTITGFLPPPPEIVDNMSSSVEILNALGEPTLHSLGLAASTPPGLVQSLIENIHVGLDVPWFAAIIGATICLRTLFLPVTVLQMRNAIHFGNHMPVVQKLQAEMMKASQIGDHPRMIKTSDELMNYMKRNNVQPWRFMVTPMFTAPVFISVFWGLSGMTKLPVESLVTGGAYWFTDLTVMDPYYILPAISAATIWFALKSGAEGVSTSNAVGPMKWFARIIPITVFVACCTQPMGVVLYWTTSNMISVFYGKILKTNYCKNLFNIPESVQHPPEMFQETAGQGKVQEQVSMFKRLTELQHEMEDRQKAESALKFKNKDDSKAWQPPKSLKDRLTVRSEDEKRSS